MENKKTRNRKFRRSKKEKKVKRSKKQNKKEKEEQNEKRIVELGRKKNEKLNADRRKNYEP